MNKKRSYLDFFVAGGTLPPHTRSYVKRAADDELLELVEAGMFCYVLTSRQMGKSSLMSRTAVQLKKQGVRTAIIDLSQIGTVRVDEWYLDLLVQLKRQLRLSAEPIEWWQARADLGQMSRFNHFLRDVMLTEITEKVVIFIDEIDTTLKLEFTDDFFAAIRAIYNARAHDAEFERVTFVLLGAATPPDLIKDRTRTPFNIGKPIALSEFRRAEASVLQEGLDAICPGQGEAIFNRIYRWSNGHPYLTQYLCLLVAMSGQKDWNESQIDQLVEQGFLGETVAKDTNLQFVQDKVVNSPQRLQLLNFYQKVYQSERVADDKQSLIQNQLKLVGLIKAKNGTLMIRNPIYRRVFDLEWVKKNRLLSSADFFAVTGALAANSPSYVKRAADDELLKLALAGRFCYLLAPHQMGKSSLMIRTADRLKIEGVKTAIINLTEIGSAVLDEWYVGLLSQLTRRLHLMIDPTAWWKAQARAQFGHRQRLTHFLRDVILNQINAPVVIFIDEIETTLRVEFVHEFLTALEVIHNTREVEPKFQRLTFILGGAVFPFEQLHHRPHTLFRIGEPIELSEFSPEEASGLQEALDAACPNQGEAILDRIYHWTNGHPHLTQQLCLNVVRSGQRGWSDKQIDALVQQIFHKKATDKESHLQLVQNSLLNSRQRRQLLNLYQKVHTAQSVADDSQSMIQNELKWLGLVKAENGYLDVRNEIYRHVFDRQWAKKNTPINWRLIVAGMAIVVAVSIVGLIAYHVSIRNQSKDAVAEFHLSDTPTEQVAHLAKLLRLQGLFPGMIYRDEARQLFFRLSHREQLALFIFNENNENEVEPSDSDRIALVQGLYTTLADVDARDRTRPLLNVMLEALNQLDESQKSTALQNEITTWLEARKLAQQNELDAALSLYNQAIDLNDQNPATLYERARLLTNLSKYEEALADLERIVEMASIDSLTNAPTPMQTADTPTSISTSRSAQTPRVEITPTDPSLPAPFTAADETSTTSKPPTCAIISQFDTPEKMIASVNHLIQHVPELLDALTSAPTSATLAYQNLQRIVQSPTATASPSSESNITPQPVPTGTILLARQSQPQSAPTKTPITSPYEPNDSQERAYGPLISGELYQAYPEDENDWYYIVLENMSSLKIEVTRYGALGQVAVYEECLDEDNRPQRRVVANANQDISTISIPNDIDPDALTDLPAGKYLVRVYTVDNYKSDQLYRLRVEYK